MSDTALPDAADSAVGALKNGLDQATDKVQAGISQARTRAKAALDQGSDQVQQLADTVGPFVVSKPYTALALAAAGGLVLGLLFFGRAPRIVYVKPRD